MIRAILFLLLFPSLALSQLDSGWEPVPDRTAIIIYSQCGPWGCEPGWGGPGYGPQGQPDYGPQGQEWTPPVDSPDAPEFHPVLPSPPGAKPPTEPLQPIPLPATPIDLTIQETVINIEKRLTILEEKGQGPPGPPGSPGEAGPKGDKGDKGDPGPPSQIDYTALEEAVWAKIEKRLGALEAAANQNKKPFHIRIYDPDGRFTTPYVPVKEGDYVDLIFKSQG